MRSAAHGYCEPSENFLGFVPFQFKKVILRKRPTRPFTRVLFKVLGTGVYVIHYLCIMYHSDLPIIRSRVYHSRKIV